MSDVMEQTREANLYAPTGTRNYWQPEAIPYAQGSDHDVFFGLGIPATMLGHDPDWTHHTSEDKIDKTDASECRRVGVLASAAAYWAARPMISLGPPGPANRAGRIEELGRRLASDSHHRSTRAATRESDERKQLGTAGGAYPFLQPPLL